jgi:hypothetical protein
MSTEGLVERARAGKSAPVEKRRDEIDAAISEVQTGSSDDEDHRDRLWSFMAPRCSRAPA